jgi:hypothetical protein
MDFEIQRSFIFIIGRDFDLDLEIDIIAIEKVFIDSRSIGLAYILDIAECLSIELILERERLVILGFSVLYLSEKNLGENNGAKVSKELSLSILKSIGGDFEKGGNFLEIVEFLR